jgi:hypothetical protein
MEFRIGKVTSQVVDASKKRAESGRNKDMDRTIDGDRSVTSFYAREILKPEIGVRVESK